MPDNDNKPVSPKPAPVKEVPVKETKAPKGQQRPARPVGLTGKLVALDN